VGSVGDAYDNALAETIISLYKTEVIEQLRPWLSMTHVEIETLGWVDCFNNRRLLEPIGSIPPVEFEALYDRSQASRGRGGRTQAIDPTENPGRSSAIT